MMIKLFGQGQLFQCRFGQCSLSWVCKEPSINFANKVINPVYRLVMKN